MQFASSAKAAVGIFYDSDFGRNIDSVLSLALLHGLSGKTQARVATLSVNYPSLPAAQLCDIVESFYRKPVGTYLAGPAVGVLDSPAKKMDPPPLVKAMLDLKDADKPKWQSNIKQWNDTAVPEILIRNSLEAQQDGNAVIVLSGAATNLTRLLALPNTAQLITAKVKMLVVAGAEAAAAKSLFDAWPTPITFCGPEVGTQLLFPAKCIETEFSYAPAHPVADAYRAGGTMPYNAPTCALAAMLYAIRPGDGNFSSKPAPNGKHSYLSVVPEKQEETIAQFTSLVSAKPVFPAPRGPK